MQPKDPFSSKIRPLRKAEKEMSFKERAEKFDEYFKNEEDHGKIFSELGFSYVEDDSDDFCDDCDRNGCCPNHPGTSGMYADGRLNLDFKPGPLGIPIYVDLCYPALYS